MLLNKKGKLIKTVFFSIIFLTTTLNIQVLAAGPWKGKVIDIETKEPLEGAVVLAVWHRNYRTPYGGSSYFYEAKEVLTDKEGGFEIPAYTPINLLPIISYIKEPEFVIFKPGYGSLRMALGKYLTGKKDVELYGGTFPSGYSIRVSTGLIELEKLKTREQRLESARSLGLVSVPDDKKPNLVRLREMEFNHLY